MIYQDFVNNDLPLEVSRFCQTIILRSGALLLDDVWFLVKLTSLASKCWNLQVTSNVSISLFVSYDKAISPIVWGYALLNM